VPPCWRNAPFLFGYATPFGQLRRTAPSAARDMVWVAAAGPATNILLATAACIAGHLVVSDRRVAPRWTLQNLESNHHQHRSRRINMIPLPPPHGGRVASLLPDALALPSARLERYGMVILIGLLFVLPTVGAQLGTDLDILRWLVAAPSTL